MADPSKGFTGAQKTFVQAHMQRSPEENLVLNIQQQIELNKNRVLRIRERITKETLSAEALLESNSNLQDFLDRHKVDTRNEEAKKLPADSPEVDIEQMKEVWDAAWKAANSRVIIPGHKQLEHHRDKDWQRYMRGQLDSADSTN